MEDLVGRDDELVAGRRPVEEAFVAGREARRLLVVPQRREALERLVLHATSLRIPIVEVEGGTLTSLAGFDGHQGIAVVVAPRTYASLDDVLARAIERGEPPFVLALDSLEDPQNVGTLLRTAEAAGVHGVLFPTRRQAPLTPAAVKASAGAVEHLLLCPVDDLAGALSDLHVRGLRIAGAEADAPLTAREADLRGPLAIVVGSEGQGLGPAVRRRCDLLMRIPMRGAIDSLNAAVAGSILLFEAVAQRGLEASGKAAPAAGRGMKASGGPKRAASRAVPSDAAIADATPADATADTAASSTGRAADATAGAAEAAAAAIGKAADAPAETTTATTGKGTDAPRLSGTARRPAPPDAADGTLAGAAPRDPSGAAPRDPSGEAAPATRAPRRARQARPKAEPSGPSGSDSLAAVDAAPAQAMPADDMTAREPHPHELLPGGPHPDAPAPTPRPARRRPSTSVSEPGPPEPGPEAAPEG